MNDYYEQKMSEERNAYDVAGANWKAAEDRAEQSRSDYDLWSGEAKSFGSFSEAKEDAYGVAGAKDAYEQTKHAIYSTQALINRLPGTVAGRAQTTGRAMTQSQFEGSMAKHSASLSQQLSDQTNVMNNAKQGWLTQSDFSYRDAQLDWQSQKTEGARLEDLWRKDLQGAWQQNSYYRQAQAQLQNTEAAYQAHRQQMAYLEQKREMMNAMAETQRQLLASQKRLDSIGASSVQSYAKYIQNTYGQGTTNINQWNVEPLNRWLSSAKASEQQAIKEALQQFSIAGL